MKSLGLLTFVFLPLLAFAEKPVYTYDKLLATKDLEISRADSIIADNLLNVIKLTEKSYVSKDVLTKVISETKKSKHFKIFLPWLNSIQDINATTVTADLLTQCRNYVTKKAEIPLEKFLEKIAGNFCREKALEAIGREVDKTGTLSDSSSLFIQENLKFFLTKKSKSSFGFFIQSLSNKPELLKKISKDVSNYSVSHGVVPSQPVLKDMLITEQITKLIQDKGFNPLQHQNVFYTEYGKLIEMGYKTLNPRSTEKPDEKKIKEHYKFLRNYLELNEAHLPVGLCLSRLNDFSKATFRTGLSDLSREMFHYIISKNFKDIKEDALYFQLWTYIYTNDYKNAFKTAESYQLLKKKDSIEDPRLKFWLADTLEHVDKKDEAIKIYENILANSPLSYYAIMASKKIQTLDPNSEWNSFYLQRVSIPSSVISFSPEDLGEDHVSSLVRLRAWARMDNQRMLKIELKRLNLHSAAILMNKFSADQQKDLRSELHVVNAKLIQESKNYLSTFRYVYSVLDKKQVKFTRELLDLLYPRPFLDQLTKHLKNDSADPLVVLSLIRQESVFNPLARSPVGARGLMQLMPSTARRFKRSVNDKHLVNPTINMDIGIRYLKNLLKRYDGNLVYTLAAYNAGESRVARWKDQYFDTDASILKNIESIPFLETRNYVKLIFRNIYFYKILTEQKKELADTGAHNKIFDVELGFKR
jgi:soluble lytic murein transglycosylase